METMVSGRILEVAVVVNGQRQPIYRRQRDNQPFVEGLWGTPFMLEVRNLTGARVEILNSVDGRNTLLEEQADVRLNSGMVVGPHDVWTITGWRIDDNNTAQFVFTDPTQSVEQMATGQSRNNGVFGFAVYREYVHQPVYRGAVTRSGGVRGGLESMSFGGMAKGLETLGGDMGTGIGDVQRDRVGRTSFRRASERTGGNLDDPVSQPRVARALRDHHPRRTAGLSRQPDRLQRLYPPLTSSSVI